MNEHKDQHIEWQLPRTPRSVGRARALLAAQARDWKIPDDVADTAVLLLSELMTNACRHARVPAGRAVRAAVSLVGDVLRVEVHDASDALPQPRSAAPDDESGRGLTLVAALADDWGVGPRPYGIGKVVWFELHGADTGLTHTQRCPQPRL
ncbi:ATP-binding protein [Streptomyces sp. NBC_01142]|uniref:ATP-binding protein n=1 Tax=Streptomyces sp. NBC_01142 TaxID=2975865 RepID=UPI00225B1B9C|nr:ATP-binding protein [Streptomyces sp. NBC_01142]MCX4819012.1 ATP-binding protein [Streptomyces sp. NBC_01142]